MTTFELKGTGIGFDYDKDVGKYLNTGDYVIIDYHYYRISSKICDTFKDKWIFVIEDAYSHTNPLLPHINKEELND